MPPDRPGGTRSLNSDSQTPTGAVSSLQSRQGVCVYRGAAWFPPAARSPGRGRSGPGGAAGLRRITAALLLC